MLTLCLSTTPLSPCDSGLRAAWSLVSGPRTAPAPLRVVTTQCWRLRFNPRAQSHSWAQAPSWTLLHITSVAQIIKTLPGCSRVPPVRGGKEAEDSDPSEMTGSNRRCLDSNPDRPPGSPTAGGMISGVCGCSSRIPCPSGRELCHTVSPHQAPGQHRSLLNI